MWDQLYYDNWVAREGLDLVRGSKVDTFTVPLKYWERTGGYAVQIQLDGTGELNWSYVCETPPGKRLEPQRHLYEELVFVLSGRGSTSVWYREDRKKSFEWQAGSLFAIPLNAGYQHFNLSGDEPVRYVAVTTAPVVMNLFRDDSFIFDNDAVFPGRYAEEPEYFAKPVSYETFSGWDIPLPVAFSNFIADINRIPLQVTNRGVDTLGMMYEIGNGVLGSHALQVPGGTFTKVHRHGPGAHVLWLKGEGYTLMWPDGGEKSKIVETWGPGTMLVPPSWWWHTHAITSSEPAHHVALKMNSKRNKMGRLSNDTMKSTRAGGSQMNYEDFPPELMAELSEMFAAECAKRGTPVRMDAVQDF